MQALDITFVRAPSVDFAREQVPCARGAVAVKLRYRSPSGETRSWTLREILQGKPIDRPIHPMLVHFPIAFYVGALALDLLSRAGRFPAAPLAGTWIVLEILGVLVMTVAADIGGSMVFKIGYRVEGRESG